MKIVFFGSSEFAVLPLLGLLKAGHSIACVVTRADKKSGRGMHLSETPVKQAALKAGLEVYQPEDIRLAGIKPKLEGLNADLFVVIAYGYILPAEILRIPRVFSINLHASLLPKYRGAAPINWAIINGEKATGNTVIKMDSSVDTGEIISQKEVLISDADNAATLGNSLSQAGTQLLIQAIGSIEENSFTLSKQDEKNASFAPKIRKEDGLIDWNKTSKQIYDLIRGCYGWPSAFTYYKGKLLKIHKAGIADGSAGRLPGGIIEVSKKGIAVASGDGRLLIEELQLEGKKAMLAEEFALGQRIKGGDSFAGGKE